MRYEDPAWLVQTEMVAGHGGPSGRYEAWRKEAFALSFVLDSLPGWHEPSSAQSPTFASGDARR